MHSMSNQKIFALKPAHKLERLFTLLIKQKCSKNNLRFKITTI